jgi:membrane dipeptidase
MAFTERARELHDTSFVFDALVVGPPSPSVVDRFLATGYNGCNWTVAGRNDSTLGAMHKFVPFYWLQKHMPDKVRLVESAADLDASVHDGRLGIVMGFQGAEPIESSFDTLELFYKLGLQIIQLTYNEGNRIGAGCLEPNDLGLSHLGIQAVRDMNRLGILVDVTHAGEKTSLDAIEVSDHPVVFSHSSAKAVRDSSRNISDRQLKAVAAKGGVTGMATFADFVGDTAQGQPNVEQYVNHIAYAVDLIGIDYVGIGTDILETTGPVGVRWKNGTKRRYPEICGAMDEHMHGIKGFETWDEFPNATEALLNRGFSEDEVRKIIGGNFKRVLSQVIG